MYTSFPSNIFIVPDSSLGRVWGFGVNGPRFKPRWSSFLSILWVFRFHNFMSKMSQESQVNLNFADYDKLGLRLSAISISLQSEERQVWPVGCPRAGCKIGRRQKWQRRLILKNQTVCPPGTAGQPPSSHCLIFENKVTLPFLIPADFTACPKTANQPDLLLLALRRYWYGK